MEKIERGEEHNIYALDLYTAITTIYEIWNNLDASTIYNCWVKTELIDAEHNTEIDNSRVEHDSILEFSIEDLLENE